MATHSSILAWRIPWTEEPGRLQSIGTQLKQLSKHACMHACMWSSGRALSSSDNPGSPHSPTPGPGDSASVDSHMAPPPPPTAAALI